MSEHFIVVGEQKNGLLVYKKVNKDVGGFIYYSEENSASDIGALPILYDALISIECLEIILNDMKKSKT